MQTILFRVSVSTLLSALVVSSLTLATLPAQAEPQAIRSTLQDQQDIAVTIYNGNLALIKDQRRITLANGRNQLDLRDVSAEIRPETALLRNLSAAGSLAVLEQNFDFDLLTPEKLLEKYVGRSVGIIKTHPTTGAETIERAEVLSANQGVVLKIANRIETGIPGRIVYDDVPANLRDRPTLTVQLDSKRAGEQPLELSYLTSGLDWKADYVAELNAAEDKLDLSGWVTLSNTSGTAYQNAKLQLVAGNLNRVQPERPVMVKAMRGEMMDMAASAPMVEESLLDYHLYTLERRTTIANNQSKQVALLSGTGIPASKELVLRGADYYYQSSQGVLGEKLKPAIYVEFANKENAGLGMPLPKGILRVYKKDSAGHAQFVGEDQIEHTAKNEVIRLKLGEAFDITADKKQTDYKKLPNPAKGLSASESSYEIVLRNAKKEKVSVTVQEPIPGTWKILQQSHASQKIDSRLVQWKIDIPAEGSATLNYRVQVSY